MHLWPVDESYLHMCTDKWCPTASTLYPLSISRQKLQTVSPSYAQSKAQRHHPQRIS